MTGIAPEQAGPALPVTDRTNQVMGLYLTRASPALSRLTPYLTPYAAIVAGFRRTESLGDRPILSTRWPSTGITERTADELEIR